jgi:hypothetical protein
MKPPREMTTPELVAEIRRLLLWIEELSAEEGADEEIDELVEELRPMFEEYQLRLVGGGIVLR